MTKVEVFRSIHHGYYKVQAINHADDPLICAAVSAILQGLVGALMNIEPKPHIAHLVMNDGEFIVDIFPMVEEEHQAIIDALFFFVEVSIAQIEKKYPQNVLLVVNNY